MLDLNAQYLGLEKNDVYLTDEQKKYVAEREAVRNAEFSTTGTSKKLGGTLQGYLFMIFAFIQNAVKGDFSKGLEGIGDTLSSASGKADEQRKLFLLQQSSMNLFNDLAPVIGDKAASLITGQKPVSGNDPSAPVAMEHSYYADIRKTIDLPIGTKSNLNPQPADPTENLSPSVTVGTANPSLTQR